MPLFTRRQPPHPPPTVTIAVPGAWTPAVAAAAAAAVFSHLVYARGQAPAPLETLPDGGGDGDVAAAPPPRRHRPTPASRRAAAVGRLAAAARAALSVFTPGLFAAAWPRRLLIAFGPAAGRPLEAYEVAVAPSASEAEAGGENAETVRRTVARSLLAAACLPTADLRATRVHVCAAAEAASEAARAAGLAPRRALAPALARARRLRIEVGPVEWIVARAGGGGEADAAPAAADVIWWGVRDALVGVPPRGDEGSGGAGWVTV